MICTLLLAALAAFLQVSTPPRDPAPRPTVTADARGSVEGRITDRSSGAPIPRAIVLIRPAGSSAQPQATTADASGNYRFENLQPGGYTVTAQSPENTALYLAQRFGEEHPVDPMRAAERSASIDLKPAEVRQADVALSRALAIEGRVFGENGEPLVNMRVSALVASLSTPGPPGAAWKTTDDRGAFRLFSLRPGEYRVCVESGGTGPATSQSSDSERHLRTCHPATLHEGEGRIVTLSSEDVSGVDIHVQRGRVYTIMGVTLDSSGAPMVGGTVNLVRGDGSAGTSSDIQLTEGRFLARGLPPGDYTIRAEIGGPVNYQDKREREVGLLNLRVESDLEGIVLQTAKGARITGRVEFEGAMPPSGLEQLRIRALSPAGTGIFLAGPAEAAALDQSLTFRLEGLFGPHVLNVSGAPRPWLIKAIRYRGEDVSGLPTEFKTSADPSDLVVVLTDKGALVSGRVTNENADPVPGALVMLMPADPRRQAVHLTGNTVGTFSPGGIMVTTVGDDGTFRLPPVRAGEYSIVAISPEDVPRGSASSTQFAFARLARLAQRLVLADSEEKTLGLRLVSPR